MLITPKFNPKTLVALAIAAVLIMPVACTESNVSTESTAHHHGEHDNDEESVDLIMLMGRLQLFMNKLYFSGINNNEALIDFYVHEMEEAMEVIAEGEVSHGGVDISTKMESFGLAQLELFEDAIESGKDFKDAYNGLVASCNGCHQATKYPFIIIAEPTNMIFDNQVYTTE